MGRLKVDKNYFNKVCLYRILWALTPLLWECFLPPGIGRTSFRRECCLLISGRKGEARTLFLYLLFCKCFQLKIILMPKCHILGKCILQCFSGISVVVHMIFKKALLWLTHKLQKGTRGYQRGRVVGERRGMRGSIMTSTHCVGRIMGKTVQHREDKE